MRHIVVTGGEGFIGSNFIRYVLGNSDDEIVNVDLRTYAGQGDNLRDIREIPELKNRYHLIHGNVGERKLMRHILSPKDIVVHFAAESHVDRSLKDGAAEYFMENNAEATRRLLECCVEKEVAKFIHISTDEVYGQLELYGKRKFVESDPLEPRNPYSVSKARAEEIVKTFFDKLPISITRSSNNYGPWQYPEKFIPLAVTNFIDGKCMGVYGDGQNIRDWIHVMDNCEGIFRVIENGRPSEVYNIGGGNEINNLELAIKLAGIIGRDPNVNIKPIEDRKDHDLRYALDCSKIKNEVGWEPRIDFKEGLKKTVEWYCTNSPWWKPLKEWKK